MDAIFQDKANYWKPNMENEKEEIGYTKNLKISLGKIHYKIEFDLFDKLSSKEVKHIVFLTSNKLLVDSLSEHKAIVYLKQNMDIYFPEISDQISQL